MKCISLLQPPRKINTDLRKVRGKHMFRSVIGAAVFVASVQPLGARAQECFPPVRTCGQDPYTHGCPPCRPGGSSRNSDQAYLESLERYRLQNEVGRETGALNEQQYVFGKSLLKSALHMLKAATGVLLK